MSTTHPMTTEEREARWQRVIEREMEQPETYWWLSFVDSQLPAGQRFVGACVVKAHGMVTAVRASHENNCNPGGAVSGTPFPPHVDLSEWSDTILSKADVDRFDQWMNLHHPLPHE